MLESDSIQSISVGNNIDMLTMEKFTIQTLHQRKKFCSIGIGIGKLEKLCTLHSLSEEEALNEDY